MTDSSTTQKKSKTCSRCKLAKDVSEFHRETKAKDGFQSRCKKCSQETFDAYRKGPWDGVAYDRRKNLRKFSLSEADYERMMDEQSGVCAICREPCKSGRRLSVDHNRRCCEGESSCGACVRGLLCGRCNRSLGGFQDTVTILKAAISYLRSYGL